MPNFFINPALKKFLSHVKPYRWLIVVATIFGLLKYNIPLIFPLVLKNVIDHLLSPSSYDTTKFHYTMTSLVVLYMFWAVATYLRSYFADRTGQRIIFDLRHELYVHLQRMSLSFYEKRQVGSVASRLLGDIASAQNFVGAAFTNTLMDASAIFLISFLLFRMNWRLALVSFSILPFYIVLNKYFKSQIKKTSQLAQRKMEEISGNVHEKLGGISIIQSYTREKAEEKLFLQDNREYLSYKLKNVKHNAYAQAMVGFLTTIAPVLVIWYGAIQVIHGHLTVGELTAFYAYLGMFYTPLNRLTELNILLANSQSAIERIFEVFNTSPDVMDHPNAKEFVVKACYYNVDSTYNLCDEYPTTTTDNIAINNYINPCTQSVVMNSAGYDDEGYIYAKAVGDSSYQQLYSHTGCTCNGGRSGDNCAGAESTSINVPFSASGIDFRLQATNKCSYSGSSPNEIIWGKVRVTYASQNGYTFGGFDSGTGLPICTAPQCQPTNGGCTSKKSPADLSW